MKSPSREAHPFGLMGAHHRGLTEAVTRARCEGQEGVQPLAVENKMGDR